jgi:Coenzyme PQQ synthesis protein D (PqqD)
MTFDATTHALCDARFSIPANVFAREFEGELVILDLEGGDYFGLDAMGRTLWESLSNGGTVREVAARIGPAIAVAPELLLRDLEALTAELLDKKLLARQGSL